MIGARNWTAILLLAATTANADERADALQTALQVCRQQTERANLAEMQSVADLTAQVKALQAKVKELEDAAKKGEAKK